MALNNYTALVASVQRWLKRQDLSADVPDFIALAEAQLNRTMHCRDMEYWQQLTLNGEYMALTPEPLQIRSLKLNMNADDLYDGGRITYRTIQQFDDLPVNCYGAPRHYTVVNGGILLWPTPILDTAGNAFTANLKGRQPIPPLASAEGGTNWLLAKHPDAYLYGALLQSAPYLKADDRVDVWAGIFTKIITDIEEQDRHIVADTLQTVSNIGDRARYRYNYGANPY